MSLYFRKFALFYVFVFALSSVVSEKDVDENKKETNTYSNMIEDTIIVFERYANLADTNDRRGVLPVEEIEKLYDKMVQPVKKIIEQLQEQNNVYKFIEAKGIDRVILPYLHIYNPELRMRLLNMTKLLFDVAPTTTSVMIPIGLLDKLLEIYEDEEDQTIKAQTVNILYDWLPQNPKVQARVMKLKGLELFYRELESSSPKSVFTQLKLFSKILKEHLMARDQNQQKSKSDYINLNVYKKIGLIERLSSTHICKGLFNVFHQFYNPHNKDFMLPVFEILSDTQPFCAEKLKGQTKAANVVKELQKYIKEISEDDQNLYLAHGLNITNLEQVLVKYLEAIDLHEEL